MDFPIFGVIEKTPVILDGAMGTRLMNAGIAPGEAPERVNIDHPEVVENIHREYFNAGADVVITNTFGANVVKLKSKGLADQADAINAAGAGIALNACPPGKWVAGDMGPTGRFLKPLGDLTREEMEAAFKDQARVLVEGGVHFLIIETMYALEEAVVALHSAKAQGSVPVVASMTFNKVKDGFFTMMGESLEEVVSSLDQAGADGLGANCTLGTQDMILLAEKMRKLTSKPILIQPNAGKPVLKDGITRYEQTPEEFAADAKAIRAAGVDMIGGCCGTDPNFIRELARVLE
ncbi:MAG: homocysteine S-methyltransferase family protein [Deltaproteobacteria bacterium]|nr:homocysteine S-methyltransferase family protein [Deltaproteobacteria bacterium]MBW2042170.1 homocysteine S-methyltransferase family protein [Deltaproteobacteria bacterium]